jgi:hypothetical protein
MAFTVAIIGGVTMAGSLLDKPERKAGKKVKNKSGGMPSGSIEASLLVLGLVLLASLAVGIYAFTHPVWRQADPVEYEHQGAFSYTAQAPAGVYDGKTVQTGEPIFPALTCSLETTFSYALFFDGLQGAGGSYQIAARISEEQSNWQRSVPLVSETAFSGKSFDSEFRIDLCKVEDLVAAMEEATDFHPSSYKLEIIPSVTTTGTFAGQAFEDTFAPILLFRFDALHFYLNRELEGDPLHPIQTSLLPDPTLVQDRLPLFGAEPRVISLRTFSIVGMAVSCLGLLALGLLLANISRRDPQAYIRMKYGGMLVDASDRRSVTSSKIIEVDSIDSLARVAERNNAMIVHDLSASVPSYYVDIDGKTYCFKGSEEVELPKRKRRKDAG